MGKTVSIVFDPIFFMLAGNEGMHESSEEIEVRPDPTPPTVASGKIPKVLPLFLSCLRSDSFHTYR